MISSSISHFWLQFCLIILFVLSLPSINATDPDPLQDICVADLNSTILVNGFPCKPPVEVTSDDFFFDLSEEGNTSSNPFGLAVKSADVLSFPGVNTQGVSITRVDIAVDGINPPHTHPRATEFGVIISGKLLVGFITTNNVFFSKVLTTGMIFVIPRALVHFQINIGQEKALFFASFNSQLPGVQIFSSSLFNTTPPIPNEVLTRTYLVSDDVINVITAAIRSAQI